MTEQTASSLPADRASLRARIHAAWRGRRRLAWAFWGFHVGGSLVLYAFSAFGVLLLSPFAYTMGREALAVLDHPLIRGYYIACGGLYVLYSIASTVMVWRCSFNVGWLGWAYVARAAMVLWLVHLVFQYRTLLAD